MKPFFRAAFLATTVVSVSMLLADVSLAQQTAPPPPKPAVPMAPKKAAPLPKLPAGVAARVNGTDVTFAQLSATMTAWAGRPLLQQYVQQLVIEQEAKKTGVTVTPAELASEVTKVKQQQIENQKMRGEMLTWSEIASRDGVSDTYVADNVRLGLLARKAYAKSLEKNIPSLDGQIQVAHILIPTVDLTAPAPDAKPKTPEEEKKRETDAKTQADQILADIKGGKITFEEAAKQFSADKGPDGQGSAANGGALPFTGKGRWDPDFENAAFALQKSGDLTPAPIKSRFGYHIIKLLKKGSDAAPAEKAAYKKQQVDQQLQNPQGIGQWVQFLMTNAKVQYNSAALSTKPAPAVKAK